MTASRARLRSQFDLMTIALANLFRGEGKKPYDPFRRDRPKQEEPKLATEAVMSMLAGLSKKR